MKVNENELLLGPSFIKRINSMNVWFLMCWSSPVCRGSCWAHAAVTAPCAVPTSPVWFAGSAREAPGAVSSATSSTMSWPSAPRTRCRYSISLKLQRIWVRAKHWRASRFIGFYKRSKMMPSHCFTAVCFSGRPFLWRWLRRCRSPPLSWAHSSSSPVSLGWCGLLSARLPSGSARTCSSRSATACTASWTLCASVRSITPFLTLGPLLDFL